MQKLGERVLWLRVRDYLRRYHPAVIGVTGSSGTELTKDALTLLLAGSRHVRVAPVPMRSRAAVALAALGATSEKITTSWLRLLAGSRVKELAEEEPTIILLALTGDTP